MAEKRISLDVIGVAQPCHEDWSGMTGGEQKKFCDSCAKHVHNLSEMSRDEAERFVTANPTGVCIRFHRDAGTGRMLTADDRCASACEAPEPRVPGRGRFSGPVTWRRSRSARRTVTSRRASCRMAGHVFVPFLSLFSLLAGAVAVFFGGARAAGPGGCTMGIMAPLPQPAPRYTAAGIGSAPVPLPPAGFLTRPLPAQAQPLEPVEPAHPAIMGRIAPGALPPAPVEPPVAPEIMGEIEMIMGDIACPEEPLRAVEPIESPPSNPPEPAPQPAEPGSASQV